MKKREYKRHRKRVRKAAKPWLYVLGLLWYEDIQFLYYDSKKAFHKATDIEASAHKTTYFCVFADWRYMTATIAVNLPAIARLSDEKLERSVVHELVHILVNEMREPGINHEERVVTMLTKAFLWTRANALEQFGGKPT